MSENRWEGHENRMCGQHSSVGYRAWCLDCHEWCYPRVPCIRCDQEIVAIFAERDHNRELKRARGESNAD